MTLRTVTYDTATHKIVPIEPTNEMLERAFNEITASDEHTELGVEQRLYCTFIERAPEYQEPESSFENAIKELPPTMSPYSKRGDKVVFIDMNGYESERTFARKHLIVNKIYEVESVDIGSFSSTVKLIGVDKKFNTVMFSPYQEPTKDE